MFFVLFKIGSAFLTNFIFREIIWFAIGNNMHFKEGEDVCPLYEKIQKVMFFTKLIPYKARKSKKKWGS